MAQSTAEKPDKKIAEPRSFNRPRTRRAKQGGSAPRPEEAPPEHDPHVDRQLDHGLTETFPASDPVSINPGAD